MTPTFIYIFVVFVSKNKEKRSKKRKIGHFAECLSQYTRQSGLPQDRTTVLCRVLKPWHSAKFQTFAECRRLALGKVPAQGGATWLLCRVPRLSAKSLPSARNPTLGKDPFAVGGFAEWRLPSVTLGKEFAECKLAFAECNRHSAKPVNRLVIAFESKNHYHCWCKIFLKNDRNRCIMNLVTESCCRQDRGQESY